LLGKEFYVKVRSEYSAHQLKKEHINLLSAVAQDILGQRIAFVDVITRGAARFTI